MYFYVENNPLIELVIQLFMLIVCFILTPIILYKIKKSVFVEKEIKFKRILAKDLLSNFLFIVLLGLIGSFTVLLGANYLIPILIFLIIYILIDRKMFSKYGLDSSLMFWPTLLSRIPMLLLSYYIYISYFTPRYL